MLESIYSLTVRSCCLKLVDFQTKLKGAIKSNITFLFMGMWFQNIVLQCFAMIPGIVT